MKETIIVLVTAHLLADFVFQTDWIARNKRIWWVFCLHVGIVSALTILAIGQWWHPLIGIVIASHLVIDWMKLRWLPDTLGSFLLDQGLHLAVIGVGAIYYPTCVKDGWWYLVVTNPEHQAYWMKGMIVVSGLVLTIQAGGILISKVVKPLLTEKEYEFSQGVPVITKENIEQMKGVPNGGRIIGYLERALVLLLIWINQPAGIGFLVTAKSILRFGDIKDSHNRRITEYVIIGTLLSFGWAIFVATLIQQSFKLW